MIAPAHFISGRDGVIKFKEVREMKPELVLVGEDGNAFSILGRARRAARGAGWTTEEWEAVMAEAMSGDYDHLLATMMEHFDVS